MFFFFEIWEFQGKKFTLQNIFHKICVQSKIFIFNYRKINLKSNSFKNFNLNPFFTSKKRKKSWKTWRFLNYIFFDNRRLLNREYYLDNEDYKRIDCNLIRNVDARSFILEVHYENKKIAIFAIIDHYKLWSSKKLPYNSKTDY